MVQVFISYASSDRSIAEAVCSELERRGPRCWIAPRDVPPGTDYASSIVAGIRGSKVSVLIFSEAANGSPHVAREIEFAVGLRIPIFALRIDNTPYSDSLAYYLKMSQWIDATGIPAEGKIVELAEAILRSLNLLPHQIWRAAEKAMEEMARDPFVAEVVVSSLRREHAGTWSTVRRRSEYSDYLLTCKFCGWGEAMEPGITPPRCCGDCGLDCDPGTARGWFDFVNKSGSEYWTGYQEKPTKEVAVRCKKCASEITYSFHTGPPLACPRCPDLDSEVGGLTRQ